MLIRIFHWDEHLCRNVPANALTRTCVEIAFLRLFLSLARLPTDPSLRSSSFNASYQSAFIHITLLPPSPPPCRPGTLWVLSLNANWYKYKGNMAYWCSIALRKDRWNHPVISRSPSAYAGPDLGSGTPGTTQSSRDGSPGRSAMLAQGTAFCTCDLDFSQVLPWDRIMLNLANTTGHIRPQTVGKTLRVVPSCLQYPEVPCVGAGLSPKVLEGATRETLFLLTTHQYPSYEHGVGVSQANRRETRKLGLLLSGKSSEVERE